MLCFYARFIKARDRDIATILTGVGNVFKFRHLTKFVTLGKALRLTVAGQRALQTVGGAIELSSTTLNVLIKVTEQEKEPWARNLQELLFWLEIASLSAEVSDVIIRRIRSSTRKVLSRADKLKERIRRLSPDEDVPDELLNELKAIVGIRKPSIGFKSGWSARDINPFYAIGFKMSLISN